MFGFAYRLLLVAAVVAVSVAAPSASELETPASQPAVTGPDTAAIRDFWSTLDSVWNTRDAEGFSRLFTEDASFGFVDSGRELETRPAIHQHFSEQFGRQRPELRHTTRVESVRPITDTVAAVDGTVQVVDHRPADSPVIRRFAITAVMVRDDDTWRLRLLRAYARPLPASAVTGES